MKKNETVKVHITDLNSDGAGVGRVDGQVIFVPYALPNEEVEALIIKIAKNYCVGKLTKVIRSSPNRTEAKCPYFFRCGGCDFQHLEYSKQLELKCASTIKNINKIARSDLKIKEIIPAENQWNYRNKAQFPISKDRDGNIILGFFSPKSHRVISINSCLLQTEKCNSVISAVKKAAKIANVSVYDEITHSGVLRHAVARSSENGLMLIIVTNSNKPLPDKFIETIKAELPHLTTLVQNFNTQKGNIILGDRCVTLFGDGYILHQMDGLRFKLRPLAFLQINTQQTEKLYSTAIKLASLSGNEIVFDAYCGIGVMSLMLAKKAKKLIGVEIVPEAIETAKESALENNVNNTEFLVGACEDVLPKLLAKGEKPDVLVVDPPRAGCEETLLQAISDAEIKKIVYVSCNPATLARYKIAL